MNGDQLFLKLQDLEKLLAPSERTELPWVYQFQGAATGPRVTLMAGVHGNEVGGWRALFGILDDLRTRRLVVTNGTLTIAFANEHAIRRCVRYVHYNLNRLFREDLPADAGDYEVRRARELAGVLKRSELFFDLHATSGPSQPFLMCEPHLLDDARRIGSERIVTGWATLGDPSIAGDTESFCLSHGGKAFTMENGQWDWPESSACARRMAERFLSYSGVVKTHVEPLTVSPIVYRLFFVQPKKRETFTFVKEFDTFEKLSAGTPIGRDEVETFVAPRDCAIVMPGDAKKLKIGEDLYLLASLD